MNKISGTLHFASDNDIVEITAYQVPRIGERFSYYEYPGAVDPRHGVVSNVEWVSSPLGALSQSVRIYINDLPKERT